MRRGVGFAESSERSNDASAFKAARNPGFASSSLTILIPQIAVTDTAKQRVAVKAVQLLPEIHGGVRLQMSDGPHDDLVLFCDGIQNPLVVFNQRTGLHLNRPHNPERLRDLLR